GAAWAGEIAKQLQAAKLGIFCVTPENLDSPWLHFEAGAIANKLGFSRVCTYLKDVEYGELTGKPFAQFQGSKADEPDTKKLLQTLNAAIEQASETGEKAVPGPVLDSTFEKFWPELRSTLSNAKPSQTQRKRRSPEEALESLAEASALHSQQMEMVTRAILSLPSRILALIERSPSPGGYAAGYSGYWPAPSGEPISIMDRIHFAS